MKRNRKAEAAKRQRDEAHRAAEQQRTLSLLFQMETAAGQVLIEQFDFTPDQVHEFKLLLRARYSDIRARLPRFTEHERLTLISQRFGLLGMQMLKQHYGFTPEQNDRWIKAMIAYGKTEKQTNVTESEVTYV